jgi:soluble lytic murein transglycosylase-like protein
VAHANPTHAIVEFCKNNNCDTQLFYDYFKKNLYRYCQDVNYLISKPEKILVLKYVLQKTKEYGLPESAAIIPILESSLNHRIDKKKNSIESARGLWQLKASTARDVGLIVHSTYDERLSIVKSTEGALKYLSWIRQELGNPPDISLVYYAYHAGIGRVKKKLEDINKNKLSNAIELSLSSNSHIIDENYLLKYYSYLLAIRANKSVCKGL